MDDDWPLHAIAILSREMAVIPGSTVFSCLEKVRFAVSRSQSAFGHTVSAILISGIQLPYTVPMHACTIILHIVVDSDLDHVAPVGFDGRSRDLAVDSEDLFWGSIWRKGDILDVECV
jgi:hypothetical protein